MIATIHDRPGTRRSSQHTAAGPATWALVPLKSIGCAKSRLAGALDAEQRKRLFLALAERVIRGLQASRNIEAVAVVTSGAEVAAFARTLDATAIMQEADLGMSHALEHGLLSLQTMQAKRVLMVPGDLPLLSAHAVDAIFDAHLASTHVVLVPDRHRVGTNALLCSPPQVIAPQFGEASFARHLHAAHAAGVAARVIEIEELALDLDCVDDLDCWRRLGGELSNSLFTPLAGRRHEPSLAGSAP